MKNNYWDDVEVIPTNQKENLSYGKDSSTRCHHSDGVQELRNRADGRIVAVRRGFDGRQTFGED
jgi:hypothetical protein